MEALLQHVRDNDYSATLMARKMRQADASALQALTRDTAPEVRELALRCLLELRSPEVTRTLAEALFDDDVQVQAVALKGLHQQPDPYVRPVLMQALDRSEDAYVRQQIALIIGRMGEAARPDELSVHCQREKDPLAREGCVVALARLGDPDARHTFVEYLHASTHRERARYLDYCTYIDAPWVLKPLTPLLDDETPMIYVGVDGLPRAIQHLRACDLAVELVVSLSGRAFGFEIGGPTQYDETQRAEVRRYLDALAG